MDIYIINTLILCPNPSAVAVSKEVSNSFWWRGRQKTSKKFCFIGAKYQ